MGLEGDVEAPWTRLFYEMYICDEILKGTLHSDFTNLSRREKNKWYCYAEMKMKRENHYSQKQIDEINAIQDK